jgi:hydrogenase maturation protease
VKPLAEIERRLDELETEASRVGPDAAAEILALGEEVLEHWVTAKGLVPTQETREDFRLLALHRQGCTDDPSFNACRETGRELAYHYNLITTDPRHAATPRRLLLRLATDPAGDRVAGYRLRRSALPTLVLGVGNPLMSDDGVGIRILKALAARQPALDDVEYLDVGTLSLLLLPRFDHCDALLVLDAAQLSGVPGDLRVLLDREMDVFFRNARGSVHEVGIRDLLDAARLMGSLPPRRGFVGVQPGRVALGADLSPAVQSAVATAAAHARAILETWQSDAFIE